MKLHNKEMRQFVETVRRKFSRAYFTIVKLPLMLLAIVAGFVFEFLLELPFMFLIVLGYRSRMGHKPQH